MTRTRRALFLGAVAAQLAVLYAPRAPAPPSDLGRVDLLVHASVFAAVAWTGRRAGVPTVPLLAALALHAPLSELVQHELLVNRTGDPTDVVADLAGVVVGAVLPVRSPTRDRDRD